MPAHVGDLGECADALTSCVSEDINSFRERWSNGGIPDIPISDVQDEHGRRYVDLVMEGGGMLGMGLAGYTYALEQANIRFRHVAGTSAGAINGLLLAALDKPAAEKSLKLAECLNAMEPQAFLDTPWCVRKLLRRQLGKKPGSRWGLMDFLLAVPAFWHLKKHQGLLKGELFKNWLADQLPLNSLAELREQLEHVPHGPARLALVASEISTETKIILPDMATGYFVPVPGELNPAELVRASMSIPFLFEPVRGESTTLVDGGLMSNFPINIFHVHNRTPRMPTFGVRLGVHSKAVRRTDNLRTFVSALVDTAIGVADEDFIQQHPDFHQLVGYVDTRDHSAFDITMGDEQKAELFKAGVRAAIEFVEQFNWTEYKSLRTSLCDADSPDRDSARDH